jgi:hypothetical protein
MISLGDLLHRELGTMAARRSCSSRRSSPATPTPAPAPSWGSRTCSNAAGTLPGRRQPGGGPSTPGKTPWAKIAFSHLVNPLQAEGDLGGLRAAHSVGVKTGNPDAPHTLVAIGNLLRRRGDTEGWRAAWQQAIDTGHDDADDAESMAWCGMTTTWVMPSRSLRFSASGAGPRPSARRCPCRRAARGIPARTRS